MVNKLTTSIKSEKKLFSHLKEQPILDIRNDVRKEKNMKKFEKPNWVYHYVCNGACDIDGKQKDYFPKYICDAHTHGMFNYNHPEFQVVIDYGPKEVGRLLNSVGFMVKEGKRFKNGDVIKGLYEDCDITLCEMGDHQGKPILRLIIPDQNNKMPSEAAEPYNMQMFTTQLLYLANPTQQADEEPSQEETNDSQNLM